MTDETGTENPQRRLTSTEAAVVTVLVTALCGAAMWWGGLFGGGEGHGYAQVCAQGGYRVPVVFCSQRQAHWLGPQAGWMYIPPSASVLKVGDRITTASAAPPRRSCVGQADDSDFGKAERVAWDSQSCGEHSVPMDRGM